MVLPPTATTVHECLQDVGSLHAHQRLVYANVRDGGTDALIVARLVQPHPDGVVGHHYGMILRGFWVDGTFRVWAADPVGEVRWDDDQQTWVPEEPR